VTVVAAPLTGTNGIAYLATDGTNIYLIANTDTGSTTSVFYKWNGASAWIDLGWLASPQGSGSQGLTNLVCFGTDVYLAGYYISGGIGTTRVFKYNGTSFALIGSFIDQAQVFFKEFSGALYVLSQVGALNVVSGGALVQKAPGLFYATSGTFLWNLGTAPILQVFGGEIYCCGSQIQDYLYAGSLFKWNGVNAWVTVVPYNALYADFASNIGLGLYDGKLFLANHTVSAVYLFNGTNAFSTAASAPGGGSPFTAMFSDGTDFYLAGSFLWNFAVLSQPAAPPDNQNLHLAGRRRAPQPTQARRNAAEYIPFPRRSSILPASVANISHARIFKGYRNADDAAVFHTIMKEAS